MINLFLKEKNLKKTRYKKNKPRKIVIEMKAIPWDIEHKPYIKPIRIADLIERNLKKYKAEKKNKGIISA